jgi:hypothetical protein
MAIKLNFAKGSSDSLTASGLLPVVDNFVVENQKVIVDFGGVVRSFTLNLKGASAPKQPETFSIKIKLTKKQVLSQSAKWSLKIGKGSFASTLANLDLTSTDVKAKPVKIPVTIIFAVTSYETVRDQFYSAKAGKSGAAKD